MRISIVRGYLKDVKRAMAFVQGHDEEICRPWIDEMTGLAADMKFEEAEAIRKKMERECSGLDRNCTT
jgi:excinuclease UvrABC nuclease subunit